MTDHSSQIDRWLVQLRGGDPNARDELLANACDRLRRLARKMLKDFPRLQRWEETDDVLQNAAVRIWRSLKELSPPSARDFFRLSAAQIRRELIDLARHHYGPEGQGANHASVPAASGLEDKARPAEPVDHTHDPSCLAYWTEFHAQVEHLPEEEREVFDLLWYQELPQAEAATLLGVSERTIKRRWQSARVHLHRTLASHSQSDRSPLAELEQNE